MSGRVILVDHAWITWQSFVGDVININYDVITFFQNTFILGRPGIAIIKIVTMFIKTIFIDSIKFKRIRNYVSKRNLYLYFLI